MRFAKFIACPTSLVMVSERLQKAFDTTWRSDLFQKFYIATSKQSQLEVVKSETMTFNEPPYVLIDKKV